MKTAASTMSIGRQGVRLNPLTTSLGLHLLMAGILILFKLLDSPIDQPQDVEIVLESTFSSIPQNRSEAIPSAQQAPVAQAPQVAPVAPSAEQMAAQKATQRASRLSGLRQAMGNANIGTRPGKILQQSIDLGKETKLASAGLTQTANTAKGNVGKYGFNWGAFTVDAASGKSGGIELSDADANSLRKEFVTRQGEYQQCYERALLVDSELSGVLSLEVGILAGGRVSPGGQFEGPGSPGARGRLLDCTRTVTSKLKMPAKLAGQTVGLSLRLAR